MDEKKFVYVKSLRFKLMLLVVIPLVATALIFIGISIYTNNVLLNSVNAPDVSIGWIYRMWAIVFVIAIAVLFPPITVAIKKTIVPLRKLVTCADQLALGNVDIDVPQNREDEYGMLQKSFANLTGNMKIQADAVSLLAEGDLTAKCPVLSEKDRVGKALNDMIAKNNTLLKNIADMSDQVSTASSQVAS